MSTDFSSLPVVDLAPLSQSAPAREEVARISQELDRVFSTTGFAYLINAPLSMSHDDVFGLARSFFEIPEEEKMKMAKKTFRPANPNTYRGYFPLQPGQQDNLKEGFEIGPAQTPAPDEPTSCTTPPAPPSKSTTSTKFHLSEPNVWPPAAVFPPARRAQLEQLHAELQALSARLLELLAPALALATGPARAATTPFYAGWLDRSVSTLRLLHYPAAPSDADAVSSSPQTGICCCTPHTDSGILTLLHQDPTGGLEVRNNAAAAAGGAAAWIPAPYVPGSLVVNIGDLMARVSGGRYVATLHRVVVLRRRQRPAGGGEEAGGGGSVPGGGHGRGGGLGGRLSVPFFFEPGEDCVVRSVEGGGGAGDEGVVYGDHVREKMSTWVEFQDVEDGVEG